MTVQPWSVSEPSSSASGASTAAPNSSSQVTKDQFLTLLVAQIKNQDPLNPTDGAQFLTLEVLDGGDGINSDHADWLEPLLLR